jgi:pyruvate kinase
MRRAKIVVTIGPASHSRERLRDLIVAGMDVARLNFSHGDHSFHRQSIETIRELSEELKTTVSIMQDLQGIKIRTGLLENGKAVELVPNQRFLITTRPITGNSEGVSVTYDDRLPDVETGGRILLSDGLIELEVLSASGSDIACRVITGGTLAEKQGINLPGVKIAAPALTSKDLRDLDFGIDLAVDYIALSYVRRAEDVLALSEKLNDRNADIPIIAKLERPVAIENLDEILKVCHGVMVARGDLGVEMAPEKVPVVQKHIIEKANRSRKIVIIATQMLESMVYSRRPTRAEASDVANAIFDGTDALMLSAETASGCFPAESVQTMAKIIKEAEKLEFHSPLQKEPEQDSLSFPEAVCDSAYHASRSIKTRAIIAFTQTGSTARLISKYRPRAQLLACTPHENIVRRMSLYWGVEPLQMQQINNVDELFQELENLLLKQKLVEKGDNIIILTGAPIIEKGHTSLMKLHTVKGDESGHS